MSHVNITKEVMIRGKDIRICRICDVDIKQQRPFGVFAFKMFPHRVNHVSQQPNTMEQTGIRFNLSVAPLVAIRPVCSAPAI